MMLELGRSRVQSSNAGFLTIFMHGQDVQMRVGDITPRVALQEALTNALNVIGSVGRDGHIALQDLWENQARVR